MREADLWDRIVRVMRATFGDDSITVTRDTTADDIPEWDSLSNVELMVALEAEFGMRFSTGELAALKNVGELADVIRARAASSQP